MSITVVLAGLSLSQGLGLFLFTFVSVSSDKGCLLHNNAFWSLKRGSLSNKAANMRFNDKQLIVVSRQPPDLQDRMSMRKTTGSLKKEVFKHRWFRLKYNMLFYFKIADTGFIEEEPDGVIFLVDCTARVEYDGGAPFTFSLVFGGAFDRLIILATRDQESLNKWINAINKANYENFRQRVAYLQQRLAFGPF